jgi:hypothetical protein
LVKVATVPQKGAPAVALTLTPVAVSVAGVIVCPPARLPVLLLKSPSLLLKLTVTL